MENSTQPQAPAPVSRNNLLMPVAIVIAGVLIAGAVILTRGTGNQTQNQRKNDHLEKNVAAVTADDHIIGTTSAPITLIEYSDTDCPYCQLFLNTLNTEMNKYQSTGKIAWIYRHFTIHANAPKEANATECVAALGGNAKFWQYLDLLFSKKDFTQQPYKGLNPSQLPILAASIGINKAAFTQCLDAGTYANKVNDQSQNAVASGASGTPFNIILSKAAINKDVQKLVEDTNAKIIAQNPSYPDILFLSPDKHKIVLAGAMPTDFMDQLLSLLIANNK